MKPETVVAIGVFDGVHLGHRKILAEAMDVARKRALVVRVTTFDPHPKAVVSPTGAPPLLTTTAEKVALLRGLGVTSIDVLRFDRPMSLMTPREFLEGELLRKLELRALVIGHDFGLGVNRSGSPSVLADLGKELGFEVLTVPPVLYAGEAVSSSRVRRALADGEVEGARALLSRPYAVTGPIVRGKGRGATISFPTANLEPPREKLVPKNGVYAVRVGVGGESLPAVMNIGVRPTFGEEERVLEVHVLDRTLDLRGEKLTVEFVARLRDERRFPSVDALREAILADVERARALLIGP